MTMEQLTNTDTMVRIAETPVVQSGAEQHQRPVDIPGHLWHLFINIPCLARQGQVETVVVDSLIVTSQHSPGQYERFARLWPLSWDMSAVDLCTMKMISGLRGGQGSVRAICSRWVEQCIARETWAGCWSR